MARTLRIEEDMDAAAVVRLRPVFEDLVANGEDLELDCAGVTFMDSSGVGAVVFLYKRLTSRGLRLSVSGLSGQPLQLLRHLSLTSILAPAGTGGGRG